MKRIMMMVALAAFMVAALSVSALTAFAGQSFDDPNCTKITGQNAGDEEKYPDNAGPGTVYCQSTDLPGNSDDNTNGSPPETEVTDETQGNDSNKQPKEQQGLKTNECDPNASPGLCKQAERDAAQG
jgi:hypothetical protein